MDNSLTPAEPADLNPHTRLREQLTNLTNQVWIEGRRNEDGLNQYIDQMLRVCSAEAQKVLPPEHHEPIRRLFEKENQ